jgi:hypothetical protein
VKSWSYENKINNLGVNTDVNHDKQAESQTIAQRAAHPCAPDETRSPQCSNHKETRKPVVITFSTGETNEKGSGFVD